MTDPSKANEGRCGRRGQGRPHASPARFEQELEEDHGPAGEESRENQRVLERTARAVDLGGDIDRRRLEEIPARQVLGDRRPGDERGRTGKEVERSSELLRR